MDKFSALLKEAKPLYFARKRRKRQLAVALPLMVCGCIAITCFIGVGSVNKAEELNALYASIYDSGKFDKMFASVDGVIEKMGLPVDEFGLLAALQK